MEHHRRPGERVPPPAPKPARPPLPPAPAPARSTPAAATAADVCRRYQPSEAAKALLRDEMTPDEFALALVEWDLGADAAEFQAYRLPKREAVWWGCLCAWEGARPGPSGPEDEAFRAAVRWAIDPSDPNRLAAAKAGEAAGLQSPAGLLALAASLTGGSLAPADLPVVTPPDDLTPRTVFAALRLASVREPRASMLRFARMAADVASGSLRWEG